MIHAGGDKYSDRPAPLGGSGAHSPQSRGIACNFRHPNRDPSGDCGHPLATTRMMHGGTRGLANGRARTIANA